VGPLPKNTLRRLAESLRRLLRAQTVLLGPDHPDVAATFDGLSRCVGGMLGRCPGELFAIGVKEWKDAPAAARAEWEYRREVARIGGMYPRDVEERIAEYSKKFQEDVVS